MIKWLIGDVCENSVTPTENQIDTALRKYIRLMGRALIPLTGLLIFFVLLTLVRGFEPPEFFSTKLELDGQTLANYVGIVLGTVVALAGSLVAIVLALRSQETSEATRKLQEQTERREKEQMRFDVTQDVMAQVGPIIAAQARFDVALDMALRSAGELSNLMERTMGMAAYDYLQLTPKEIVKPSGEQYSLHNHVLLMSRYIDRNELDQRLAPVKKSIGELATSMAEILANPWAAKAYQSPSVEASLTKDILGDVVFDPMDLPNMVSLLRNKSESVLSAERIVEIWYLAMLWEVDHARTTLGFFGGDGAIAEYKVLQTRIDQQEAKEMRHALLLGACISTVSHDKAIINVGLPLLVDIYNRMPTRESIKRAFLERDANCSAHDAGNADEAESLIRETYRQVIDGLPYAHQPIQLGPQGKELSPVDSGSVSGIRAVVAAIQKTQNRAVDLLQGEIRGDKWDIFVRLAWQWCSVLRSNELILKRAELESVREGKLARFDIDGNLVTMAKQFRNFSEMLRVPIIIPKRSDDDSTPVTLRLADTIFEDDVKPMIGDLLDNITCHGSRDIVLDASTAARSLLASLAQEPYFGEPMWKLWNRLVTAEEEVFKKLPENLNVHELRKKILATEGASIRTDSANTAGTTGSSGGSVKDLYTAVSSLDLPRVEAIVDRFMLLSTHRSLNSGEELDEIVSDLYGSLIDLKPEKHHDPAAFYEFYRELLNKLLNVAEANYLDSLAERVRQRIVDLG